jgi:hypothetical protein
MLLSQTRELKVGEKNAKILLRFNFGRVVAFFALHKGSSVIQIPNQLFSKLLALAYPEQL